MNWKALQPSHEFRKQRSLHLVREAYDSLVDQNKPIALSNLEAETKKVDPTGIGVNRSTFLRNKEVREFLDRKLKRVRGRAPRLSFKGIKTIDLRPGRNLTRAFQRLLKKSKVDLAQRVIYLEEEVLGLRKELAERDRLVIEQLDKQLS